MDDTPDRGDSRAPELEDLLSLCAALRRENVRYVLIGGFAVILHGWVRATKDIDLLVDASTSNVQALKRMKIEEEASVKAAARPAVRAETEHQRPRSALVAGATGLVGGFLLDLLLEDELYDRVRVLARRPMGREHPKLETVVADFDRLGDDPKVRADDGFRVDDVFCSLGTTIKKAGSEAAFRKVDHDHVASIARLAREAGARRFVLVSSIGADAGSGNFYLSVKGAAEEAVSACGYPELHVFRPSLLTGPRRERRPGERAATVVMPFLAPLLLGGLRRYRPVEARTLALAMVEAARRGSEGRTVYTFDDIVRLAQ